MSVQGQGTEFTYQGRLNANGDPANGFYDFRFRLALDDQGETYEGNVYLTNGMVGEQRIVHHVSQLGRRHIHRQQLLVGSGRAGEQPRQHAHVYGARTVASRAAGAPLLSWRAAPATCRGRGGDRIYFTTRFK